MFCSIQEYMQASDVPTATPYIERPIVQCGAGKLIDNPEALPVFTIENVADYLITRKESNNLRTEDWKSFKTGGYKIFKEGHVQKTMINQEGSVCTISCSCLPEMKKDRVYKIKIDIAVDSSDACGAQNAVVQQAEANMPAVNMVQHYCMLEDFYSTYKEI